MGKTTEIKGYVTISSIKKHALYAYWPLFTILVVGLLFSFPYFTQKHVPFPSRYLVSFFNPWTNYYAMPVKNEAMPDVITQLYPWKKITIDSLRDGALPVWNPYQFSGTPHLANVQSAVFTPFNVLFFIFPFIDAWSILVLLQPILAGLFMYLYLKSIRRSNAAIVIGSVAFMFSSFLVTWMAYGTLGYALLYLPLILYGIEKLYTRQYFLSCALIAVSSAFSVFSGHFQTSLYVIVAGLSYLLVRYLYDKSKRALLIGIVSFGIGLLIASIQLIPTIQFYNQSPRSESYIVDQSIPWTQLIRLTAPDFFGNPVTRNDWIGHYAEWGTYTGVITLCLALIALMQRNKHIYFFGTLVFICILFSFDSPLIQVLSLSKIPVISTSNPSRIVGVIGFGIAVLAAFGFDSVYTRKGTKILSKHTVRILGLVALIYCGIWILLLNNNVLFISRLSEHASIARRNFIVPTFLFGAVIIAFLIGTTKIKHAKFVSSLLIVLLLIVEMLRFSSKWMPFEPRELVYPEVAPLKFLQKNSGYDRIYGLVGNEVFGMFGLYGIEGYDPLYTKYYGEFISAVGNGNAQPLSRSAVVFPRTGRYAKEALDLLGVKYVLHSKGDGRGSWVFPFWNYPENYTMVFSDEKYEVYESKSAYPRAYLVHNYQTFHDSKEILKAMYSGAVNLRDNVLLEGNISFNREALTSCFPNSDVERADIVVYQQSLVTINTNSSCPSILFLSDVYYPGWKAYIDGERADVLRANYAFRAVLLAPGEHMVEMKYENWYL